MSTIRQLLVTIQKLYATIYGRLLQHRMHTAHAANEHKTQQDLMNKLSAYLDRLDASHTVNVQDPDIHTTYMTRTISLNVDESSANDTPSLSELSRHFKSSRSLNGMQPELCDTLRATVIDNIHASIRLAREGQRRTAELHSDIARYALQALESHSERRQYLGFLNEIELAIMHTEAVSEISTDHMNFSRHDIQHGKA